jgi:hypothetical protein
LLGGIALIVAIILCAQPMRGTAQTAKSDESRDLDKVDAEFIQLGKDTTRTVRSIPSKTSLEYECMEKILDTVLEIGNSIGHYKFSVAIKNVLLDSGDLSRTKELLNIQTDMLQNEIIINRNSTNKLMGMCSRIPLAVGAGIVECVIKRRKYYKSN